MKPHCRCTGTRGFDTGEKPCVILDEDAGERGNSNGLSTFGNRRALLCLFTDVRLGEAR
jgi:hypothetical protein